MSTKTLASLMQSLPQELYDEIYDLVFTADALHTIHQAYKFPSQLHVDRAARARFAASYYSNGSIFEFCDESALQWAEAVPKVDWDRIRQVRRLYDEGDKDSIRSSLDPAGAHDAVREHYVMDFCNLLNILGHRKTRFRAGQDRILVLSCRRMTSDGLSPALQWKVEFSENMVQFSRIEEVG